MGNFKLLGVSLKLYAREFSGLFFFFFKGAMWGVFILFLNNNKMKKKINKAGTFEEVG